MIPQGMVALPGGRFRMGSDWHYPEERPHRPAAVGAFAIDRAPVTVAGFARFVAATGYLTVAEGQAGGAIAFVQPDGPAAPGSWWRWMPGASWRDGPPDHPVVHVALADALAYAAWAGKALPTEAEWEYAAKAGGDAEYAWGIEFQPGGVPRANTWHGRFPYGPGNGTSPVGHYPANAFGLVDTIGNVWEWTADRWHDGAHTCCAPPSAGAERYVIKGGSHLCAPEYCRRYRPAARQGQAAADGTSHIGFRCVVRG